MGETSNDIRLNSAGFKTCELGLLDLIAAVDIVNNLVSKLRNSAGLCHIGSDLIWQNLWKF